MDKRQKSISSLGDSGEMRENNIFAIKMRRINDNKIIFTLKLKDGGIERGREFSNKRDLLHMEELKQHRNVSRYSVE